MTEEEKERIEALSDEELLEQIKSDEERIEARMRQIAYAAAVYEIRTGETFDFEEDLRIPAAIQFEERERAEKDWREFTQEQARLN
jgi:hypothetical protein